MSKGCSEGDERSRRRLRKKNAALWGVLRCADYIMNINYTCHLYVSLKGVTSGVVLFDFSPLVKNSSVSGSNVSGQVLEKFLRSQKLVTGLI